MERELVDLFEAAKKAADLAAASDAVSEVSRCVDALKQLRAFPVSYDILVSTQVGKRLRSLSKHPREKIQTVASDLLELWKKVVIEETTKGKKNGTSSAIKSEKLPKPSAVKSEKLSNTENVKAEKVSKDNSVKSVKVEKREANGDVAMAKKSDRGEMGKVEKICKDDRQSPNVKKSSQPPAGPPKLTSMVKCNDLVRDKFREILVEALSKVPSEVDGDMLDQVTACDPIRVAVSVESVMFEKMGKSNGAQKFKYRSIMFNIKDPNNPDLRRKVLLGEVKPERLITMTPEEMASEQRQREINEIKEKALFDCERGVAPKATTDQFKCGRCGQRKTTYYQMQTRSADEPMTTYVTCVNCNNHWKFC
ncbi:hypothetical protein ERO13_A10G153500v2 [Gossypium hirsutum]|uniref:Transcription elongation factor n=1 Tax=Gossypium hirsutum TaxID=3635 RepID=A0A1U8IHQ7_GOSHI|nr:transcription elongation factor TFIIS [Gossypium hirsutum]KAG4180225.1 hypothetical protein ERO13_A10G153500v2 [Gossypium hirsutum]